MYLDCLIKKPDFIKKKNNVILLHEYGSNEMIYLV